MTLLHEPEDCATLLVICGYVCNAVLQQFLEQDTIISASSTGEVFVYKYDQRQQVWHITICLVSIINAMKVFSKEGILSELNHILHEQEPNLERKPFLFVGPLFGTVCLCSSDCR